MAAGTLERTPFAYSGQRATARGGSSIDEVYAEHFRYVWRCLKALGVRSAQIDDAVHDVFLVVQEKLSSFDGQARVTTWLYAIALRVARRYRAAAHKDTARFERNDDPLEGEAAGSADHRDPESATEHGERLSLAQRALGCLDDDKREAFVLSQVEQMSAPEIADVTGVPLNTVYSRIRAAKLAFQSEIAALERATRGRS